MKMELRLFKFKQVVLFIPETSEEKLALADLSRNSCDDTKLNATLTSDDYFQPYIRVESR